MKWKNIVANAKTIKAGVEKNGAMPTIKNYSTAQLCYIFAKAISSPGKDVSDKKVGNCPNCTGTGINKNLTRNEYLNLAKRTVAWFDKYGVAPNYSSYQNEKVSIRLQTFCYAKIIVWYVNNKRMPNTCWFKNSVFKSSSSSGSSSSKSSSSSTCTNPYKATPYDSASGCDHMGQNNGYCCACAMLQKMFYRLGYKVSQSELAKVAGTTTAGTGHDGIETAIAYVGRKFGVKFTAKWYNLSDLGMEGMAKLMCKKNTAVGNHILYRMTWGHYEYPLVLDVSAKTIKVVNSLGDSCSSGCYCGYVETRDWSTHKDYIGGISQKSVLVITKG